MYYFWMGFYFILGTSTAILLLSFVGSFVRGFRKAFWAALERQKEKRR